MKTYKIERIATFDDTELAHKLMEIEKRDPRNHIFQVVFIGNNPVEERLYQIIYTVD